MPRPNSRSARPRSRSRPRFAFIRRRWRTFRRVSKAILKSPPSIRAVAILSILLVMWLAVNWAYHAYYKPAELLFPLDHALNKGPRDTWDEYGDLFKEYSTMVITPELLAALAQTEGGGNPVARTYWRWRWSWNPFEWYQPASSAVGMFQITDSTFEEGKRYCIKNHVVVEACWSGRLHNRLLPSHAIEMTAALLDRRVVRTLGERRATPQQKQDLAAVIHLCGSGAGLEYAKRGLRLSPHQRCGDHDVRTYMTRVNMLKQQFLQLAGK